MNGVGWMIPPWLGPVIGLISLSLGVAFFVLGRRARLKGPTWAVRSNNLVRGFKSSLPDLEIQFRKEKVDTLTVTRIAFWNRGMATMDRNDIAQADPLRIAALGNARLLDVKIVQVNSEPSRFDAVLNKDGKAAYLGFDFLDRDHGAVIQIVHTGGSGADLTIAGTIKGAGTPSRRKIRGAYLPLPTPIELDRKIKPRTRRRITRACELTAFSTVVVLVSIFLVGWLFPLQWASTLGMWATFQKGHLVVAGALKSMALTFIYLTFFMLSRGVLWGTMLPTGLTSLVDDPLEK